ncbi:hypothetical protein GCM10025864_14170 [Luteimicrobium album]|uniref:Glycosyl hydrolase family 36 N-terminal domain-containing protein n=1 Tax=Luteimicrobium album TaxID=1054550 RepID=A0ABQ6I0H7_9MICO|nr:hypothetical protein GCM10025864_14170 [Luteimicrobium album]
MDGPENGGIDEPARVSVVPESWTGWTGEPGLEGHRDGADWSPRWSVTGITLGSASVERASSPRLHEHGAGTFEARAHDQVAGLELTVTTELMPDGVVRLRATVTNRSDSPTRSTRCVSRFPSRAAPMRSSTSRGAGRTNGPRNDMPTPWASTNGLRVWVVPATRAPPC